MHKFLKSDHYAIPFSPPDENRKRVFSSGAVPVALEYVSISEHPSLVRTACGALLNFGLNYGLLWRWRPLLLAHNFILLHLPHPVEPIQREILRLDGLSTLSKLLSVSRLDHGENQAVCLAARVSLTPPPTDEGRRQFVKLETVVPFVQLLQYTWQVDKSEDLDLMDAVVDVLEATVELGPSPLPIHRNFGSGRNLEYPDDNIQYLLLIRLVNT
ncbi:hypothetical protein BC937DRAFT_89072 [Endogone sp. FLAS-F59071]|nr:hypothetical protein BC937DRAFT_89072 [Endogone sp. FLAS-F59071]|eukprot:RUS18179.1 hypothetical protein BC937DRAFT_89072 [Endogone sp. FLAS-F59071]